MPGSSQKGRTIWWVFSQDDVKEKMEDLIFGSIKQVDPTCFIPFVGLRTTITSGVRRMKDLMGDEYPVINGSVGGGIIIGSDTPFLVEFHGTLYMYVMQHFQDRKTIKGISSTTC